MAIEWNSGNRRVPAIEQIRKIRHALWCRWHGSQNCTVETDPDRHLDDHRSKTADGVHPGVFVHCHRFRRHLAAGIALLALVLFLNRLQPGLN